MQSRMILTVCAMFFGATLSAFGSLETEKFEFTKKSTARDIQPSLKKEIPTKELEAIFARISALVGEELNKNGMSTKFMLDLHEPSLEVITKCISGEFDPTTVKNQNLFDLAVCYWKFKQLSDTCLQMMTLPNYIEAPIGEKKHGESLLASNIIATLTDTCDLDTDWFTKQGDPYCLELGCKSGSIHRNKKRLFLAPPISFCLKFDASTITEHRMMFCEETHPFMGETIRGKAFLENYKRFQEIVSNHNILLNSLYMYCEKAKSYRLKGFDSLTKYIPHDNIADEAKRTVNMAHQYLKMEYMKKSVNAKIQKPISNHQNLLDFNINEERGDIVDSEVKCIEYYPPFLNDEVQKDKTAQVKKEHTHKHKRTRKAKVEQDDRKKDKSAPQVVDKKERVHKHRTRKAKVEKDESKSLILVQQSEVVKDDTPKPNAALQALLEMKEIEANAEMYALANNKTKSELIESVTAVYKENYTQMDQLLLELKNIPALYGQAIQEKMKENKEQIVKAFSSQVGGNLGLGNG